MSSLSSRSWCIGTIGRLPKLPSLQPAEAQGGFSAVLSSALQHVNQLNGGAEQQIGSLLKGGQRRHEHGDDRSRKGRCCLSADDAGSQQDCERLSGHREDAVLARFALSESQGNSGEIEDLWRPRTK